MEFITLDRQNISEEHICCAISDKKSKEGSDLKKEWLEQRFDEGYVFRKLNVRAKVFIEYGHAEKSWVPVNAPNYLLINCFWVAGQYKGKGYAKRLLQSAIDDAVKQGKDGLVTVVGTKKFHFMGDGKWFLRQGFELVQTLSSGFSLLAMKINKEAKSPQFNDSVSKGVCEIKEGIVVYYSNRCPFTEGMVNVELVETAKKRGLPMHSFKLKTLEDAQSAPSPATVFSLFYKGQFVTTDVSVCMDSRFDKILKIV